MAWRCALRYTYKMGSAAKKVLDDALALPQEEREELLGALSNSLEPIRAGQDLRSELERRVAEIQSGKASLRDAAEHLQRLRADYSGE